MRYHNITKDDMKNGEGLRVVLWLSGCDHKCPGCQNPITWNPDDGLIFDEAAEKEIFDQLEKEYIAGITFSGGDPLHESNIDGVSKLIVKIRSLYPRKNIWLYSGYTYEYLKHSEESIDQKRLDIVQHCDVFCDGPYIKELKDNNIHWVGSSNQKVLRISDVLPT